jgi:H+/Cl- antiporter ClcA/CBS domain-containing protein
MTFLRTLWIAALAMALGAVMAGIARFLLWLIEAITAVAFFGKWGTAFPVDNHLGLAVIFVPVVGGLLVGLMARYGSPAIRGHGIPEAMEQVLENASRIPARITWLKPLSAALSIGTGGPFGAEGPIIATGGAAGSLIGQILPSSATERKTLLAAGAAAGMAATFGSPLAAVLLAIELLLFEFKVRSLIPVAMAVGVAQAIRLTWAGSAPVFPMPDIAAPTLFAFAVCLVVAALMGVTACGINRAVYGIEDAFAKIPIHWMWWPAIGAIVVGIVGYIEPRTLGVGYENITENLAGAGTVLAVLWLCGLKFLSWSVALGSGTSGGTLAPLMTIGSALGWAAGAIIHSFIPEVDPHLVALVGMACLFSGASQALLAAAVFAYETTGQSPALFTLLSGCALSVLVVRALGRTSIMTEKIERRGVSVPSQFGADVFEQTRVSSVMDVAPVTLQATMPLRELARKIATHDAALGPHHAHPVLDADGHLVGIVTRGDVIRAIETTQPEAIVRDCMTIKLVCVQPQDTLHEAIQKLLIHDIGRLLVVAEENPLRLLGYLSRSAILSARWKILREETVETSPWGPPKLAA